MYRGLFLFILEFFLFGINLYGWQAVGINHAHICDFKNLLCPLRTLEVSYFSYWETFCASFCDSDFQCSFLFFSTVGRLFRCCLGRKCCSFHFLGSVWDPFLLASVSVGVFFSTFLHQHIECLLSTLQILASESSSEYCQVCVCFLFRTHTISCFSAYPSLRRSRY